MNLIFISFSWHLLMDSLLEDVFDRHMRNLPRFQFHLMWRPRVEFMHHRHERLYIHWPSYCNVYIYVVIHFCDSLFWVEVEVNLCRFFVYAHMCFVFGDTVNKIGGLRSLGRFNPLRLCICSKPGPGVQSSCALVSFMFIELKWEMICFVDIGGIVDYQYINFVFLIICHS